MVQSTLFRYLSPLISAAEFGFEKFSLKYSFLIFLSSLLNGICFLYFLVLVVFLLSKHSDPFLIWHFYSFCCLSFPTFHYKHCKFFYAKFHCCILTVYSLSLLFSLNESFHTSFNWLFFTEVWVTTSLFRSPRLFLVVIPNFNSAGFWMISTFPHLFSRPLETVPKAATTIAITFTFKFHCFIALWQDLCICWSFCFFKIFTLWYAETTKSTSWQVLFSC